VAKNNKTGPFLYCDKTWFFDQSEHAHVSLERSTHMDLMDEDYYP